MLWLAIAAIIGALFYLDERDVWWGVFSGVVMGAIVLLVFGGVTGLVTLDTATSMEAFRLANRDILVEVVAATEGATVDHGSAGDMDLGIQLENQEHSKVNAERVKELRDKLVWYNENVTWYAAIHRHGWLLWPAVNYPEGGLLTWRGELTP